MIQLIKFLFLASLIKTDCIFDFPKNENGLDGCGVYRPTSLQSNPCAIAPVGPEVLSVPLRNQLSKICPKFAAKHGEVCCNIGQVRSLQRRFEQMFTTDALGSKLQNIIDRLPDEIQDQIPIDLLPNTNVTFGLFHNCPACQMSQQEYYCNIYCSPDQNEFTKIVETYDTKVNGQSAKGVSQIEVTLPKSYLDKLYQTCRAVKQTWFDKQNVTDAIPNVTVNIVEQRFCKGIKKCDGQQWLSNQGMTQVAWPRNGVLNTVEYSKVDKTDFDVLVTPCDTNDHCGCMNCVQLCPIPQVIDYQNGSYPIIRKEFNCAFRPSCGKNLMIPDGGGLTRPDIPCLVTDPNGRPAHILPYESTSNDIIIWHNTIKRFCPAYYGNHPEGTAVCCQPEQLNDLVDNMAQIRQLFGRCPACVKTMEMVFCHSTCHPHQSLWVRPIDGFTTYDTDHIPALAVNRAMFYWTEELMMAIWDACKDVSFSQTNGNVIEDLMCDGNSGADCTVERFLNFNGGTDNGFAPYNLMYSMVTPDSTLRTFLGIRADIILEPPTQFAITESELEKLDREIRPLERGNVAYDCDKTYVDPVNSSYTEPSCSCTDCDMACPALPYYPEKEPRPTIGTGLDMWIFISIMLSVGLICLFVLILVVRKAIKHAPGIKHVSAIDTSSQMTSQAKIVHEKDISCLHKISHFTQQSISHAFEWWAKRVICRYPYLTLVISITWSGALIAGMKEVEFTTDPIRLWTSPDSRSYKEYAKFNEKFVPFYRASQIIAVLKDDFKGPGETYNDTFGEPYQFSEIMNKKYWKELFDLSIEASKVVGKCDSCQDNKLVKWADVCFNPLRDEKNPDAGGCSLFSIFQYWQNNWEKIGKTHEYEYQGEVFNTTYKNHIIYCSRTPSALTDKYFGMQPCGSDFGAPVFPFLAMGGYNATELDYWNGEALIISYINTNVEDKSSDQFHRVEAWETGFLDLMKSADLEYFDIAFFSERSIEDEIDATTESDLMIFIISYAVIFLYIMCALGAYSTWKRVPVDMKVSLAVGGILIILASALAATGVFGWANVASNLIVMEVVPFLLLAIGADNVFILVMDIQREQRMPGEKNADVISRVLGRGGPSMLLCALTESTVFFIGSVSNMPAVKVFALNAGLAILFNFVLQITAFLALIKLDMDRMEANRFDVLFFIKSSSKAPESRRTSPVQTFFTKYYTPILMNDLVGFGVVALFIAWLGASIYQISIANVGLDQNISVPSDSYVSTYFHFMETYLMVGVPVYFVVDGKFDYHKEKARNLICSYGGCDLYSLGEQVSRAAKQPEKSLIVTPATVWVDDYDDWISPRSACCYKRNCCPRFEWPAHNNYTYVVDDTDECGNCDFCSAAESELAPPFGYEACRNCFPPTHNVTEIDFMTHLDYFLNDNPNEFCAKGGHASYHDAVSIVRKEDETVNFIDASYFMAYHRVCIKSAECQQNLEEARYLATNITYFINENLDNLGYDKSDHVEVWPYAVYYPFYEQYITIAEDAIVQIAICLVPAFVFTFVLLGFDIVSGLIVLVTVTMIIIDTYGMCSLWGVDFNALTLINLIAAIGLSIEFTGHTVRAFALTTKPSRKERVIETMSIMGPAVTLGVALTNLPGIICLHWAQAQIIEIFFFRMTFVTTMVGIAHGLIFIPVILAYFGPRVNNAILYDEQEQMMIERTETMSKMEKKTEDVTEL